MDSIVAVKQNCTGGNATNEQIWVALDAVGLLRWRLGNGSQTNGPDGKKMPGPKHMDEVKWECLLEKEAITMLGGECSAAVPTTSNLAVLLISLTGVTSPSFTSAFDIWTRELDKTPLKDWAIGPDKIEYDGQPILWEYAHLAQANLTRIGCAQKNCPVAGAKNAVKHTTLCLLNIL
ncbi:hypothetical protein ANCDUO_23364 [Ancylostoma duodenale]|uniref:SCP domain-containing protein n=1 Tax=Ancylostoma duodenale TaxID=51022 RepID=A0A0C2C9T8_9BILA|nr:hypothetical protein ANCDUO_23364 [Ancylostoma duodenale]